MTDQAIPQATAVPFLDLDATPLDESRTIQFKEKQYVIKSHLDLTMLEVEELMQLNEKLKGKTWNVQLTEGRRMVQILIPGLPSAVLSTMTGRQIISVMVQVMGVADEVTQKKE